MKSKLAALTSVLAILGMNTLLTGCDPLAQGLTQTFDRIQICAGLGSITDQGIPTITRPYTDRGNLAVSIQYQMPGNRIEARTFEFPITSHSSNISCIDLAESYGNQFTPLEIKVREISTNLRQVEGGQLCRSGDCTRKGFILRAFVNKRGCTFGYGQVAECPRNSTESSRTLYLVLGFDPYDDAVSPYIGPNRIPGVALAN